MRSAPRRRPAGRFPHFPILLVLVLFVISFSGYLSERDLSLGESLSDFHSDEAQSNAFLSIATLILFFFSGLTTLHRIATRQIGAPNKLALRSIGIYFGLTVFTPAMITEGHFFQFGYFVCFVVFTSIATTPQTESRQLHNWIRNVLISTLLLSLAGALLAPTKTIAGDYYGLLDGIPYRLYGLGTGATSLAALAASLLAIELLGSAPLLRLYLTVPLAISVLVLTQSKTNWIIGIAILLAALSRRFGFARRPLTGSRENKLKPFFWMTLAAASASIIAILLSPSEWAMDVGDANLATLTGRLAVWQSSVDAWLSHPLLGYGLGLWAEESFRNANGDFAHAHNQILQALASAGILGLAGLAFYVKTLYKRASQASAESAIGLFLLLILLVNSLTDVPFTNRSIADPFFFLHLICFGALFLARPATQESQPHLLRRPTSTRGDPNALT